MSEVQDAQSSVAAGQLSQSPESAPLHLGFSPNRTNNGDDFDDDNDDDDDDDEEQQPPPSLAASGSSDSGRTASIRSHGSNSTARSFSHTRSQSMSEHHSHSSINQTGSSADNNYQQHHGATPSDLVRRNHTLSTSSRLVRLERNKARLALQGVGLSDKDRDFYLPASPVHDGPTGAWSDLGHGTPAGSGTGNANGAGAKFGLSNLGAHSRTASSGSTSVWGNSEATSSPPPGSQYSATSSFFALADSPASASFGALDHHNTSPPPPPITSSTVPRKSSFVVLRGAKGDAALTERRSSLQQPISPPRTTSIKSSPPVPQPPVFEHRNSLKAFLEADGAEHGEQEEWERSLQDERDKEERELRRESQNFKPVSTPPLSHSASFSSRTSPFNNTHPHVRASTTQAQSYASVTSPADPWSTAVGVDDAANLRRHQSLTFTRSLSSGENSPDEPWPTSNSHGHERSSVSGDLIAQALSLTNGFGHSRAPGTGPPSLSLSQSHGSTPHSSLSHSNSLSSHHGGNLSHSNSIGSGSHQSHHGHSSGAGALSPVGGFSRSPWSPTLEETKQFGISNVVGTPPTMSTLSRGGSNSSKSSGHGTRFSSAAEDPVSRLNDDFGSLEVGSQDVELANGGRKPPSPSSLTTSSNGINLRDDTPVLRPPVRSMTMSSAAPSRRLPPLMTNPDVLASLASSKAVGEGLGGQNISSNFVQRQGPASAAAFVPPIGHSHGTPQKGGDMMPSISEPATRTTYSAAPGGGGADWMLKKESVIGSPTATSATVAGSSSTSSNAPFPTAVGVNPLDESWPPGGGFGVGLAMQQQQQIQLLQTQMHAALQAMDMMKAQGHAIPPGFNPGSATTPTGRPFGGALPSAGITPTGPTVPAPPVPAPAQQQQQAQASVDSPIDIPALVASKGYNPVNFDLRPPSARFFVIKSYTEEDVHKSLKYEIWASTDLGNKRLDRAFRESGDKGPIYLFFSVNGSGHFAGVAQMLTPVDYSMSSNVWASDKWKGVLKVRWIYIKDVPLANLRHIRLSNTPENKPVTSSRDTQEVPYDAGLQVLSIIAGYNARTSLLQDFAFYDSQPSGGADGSGAAAPSHPPHYAPRPASQPSHSKAPRDHQHQPHQAPFTQRVPPSVPDYQQFVNTIPNGVNGAPPYMGFSNVPPPHHMLGRPPPFFAQGGTGLPPANVHGAAF